MCSPCALHQEQRRVRSSDRRTLRRAEGIWTRNCSHLVEQAAVGRAGAGKELDSVRPLVPDKLVVDRLDRRQQRDDKRPVGEPAGLRGVAEDVAAQENVLQPGELRQVLHLGQVGYHVVREVEQPQRPRQEERRGLQHLDQVAAQIEGPQA